MKHKTKHTSVKSENIRLLKNNSFWNVNNKTDIREIVDKLIKEYKETHNLLMEVLQ